MQLSTSHTHNYIFPTLFTVQAAQFNEAIQIVRNWLPDAEAELKFHSIPDDEDSIMQQIENLEVRRSTTLIVFISLTFFTFHCRWSIGSMFG